MHLNFGFCTFYLWTDTCFSYLDRSGWLTVCLMDHVNSFSRWEERLYEIWWFYSLLINLQYYHYDLKILIFGQLLAHIFAALLFQARYLSCQPCSFHFATFLGRWTICLVDVNMCILFMCIAVITMSGNFLCCRRVVAFGDFLTLTS